MAGTIECGSAGPAAFEITFDDNLDVLTFSCRNIGTIAEGETHQSARGVLHEVNTDGNETQIQFAVEAAAGHIHTIALPQDSKGIRLRLGARPGRYDGFSVNMLYPG